MAAAIRANFDEVYTQFKQWAEGRELTAASMVLFVRHAMVLVEHVSRSSGDRGAAKRELVLQLLTNLVADADVSEDVRGVLQMLVDNVAPELIDQLINADHGRLFREGTTRARRAWRWCRAHCCTC